VEKEKAQPAGVVLELRDLRAKSDLGEPALRGVSFDVRAGEIVGVAGVQGNGQTELVEVITGLRHADGGSILIAGAEMTNASPRRITEEGQSCHVPEDRHHHGMVDSYSIAHNLVLNTYYQPPFARMGTINETAIREHARTLVETFDVRTPTVELEANNLSGGNQQKMVVAREFSRPIRLLIAAQPTRGIDVGSIEFIHSQIVSKRDEGVAVLVVSSELDEIMALADRIVVMYKGEVIDTVPRERATREGLGLLMAGVHPDDEGDATHAPPTEVAATL
jgi:simple sugar transport system ATP-binding protein